MLKYNKTYPYLLSLFHPSVKCSKTSYWNAENISFRTTNSDFYQVLQLQNSDSNSVETFLKRNYENKK